MAIEIKPPAKTPVAGASGDGVLAVRGSGSGAQLLLVNVGDAAFRAVGGGAGQIPVLGSDGKFAASVLPETPLPPLMQPAASFSGALVLESGRIGYETDTGKAKLGNGSSTWSVLPYLASGVSDYDDLSGVPDALDAIAALTPAADRYVYYTSSSAAALGAISANARTMLAASDFAAIRTAIGLGSVENTTDLDKPISTATAAALAGKETLTTFADVTGASTDLPLVWDRQMRRFTHATPTLTIKLQSVTAYPAGFAFTGMATSAMTIAADVGVTVHGQTTILPTSEGAVFSLLRLAADEWVCISQTDPDVYAASTAEARGGTATTFLTPLAEASAAATVDHGSVSGAVTFDLSAGPCQRYTLGGDTTISPGTIVAKSGVIEVITAGAYTLSWSSAILRDVDDAALAPDPRPWVTTIYTWAVICGRMTVSRWAAVPVSSPTAPTFAGFTAFVDPASGARVGDSGSALSAVGDVVSYLPPVAGTWYHRNTSGTTVELSVANRNFLTDGVTPLPILRDRNGRRGLLFDATGAGLRANLYGVQEIGLPNPVATTNALPYSQCMTIGAMVWLPESAPAGPIFSAYRAETVNTARFAVYVGTDGHIYGSCRFNAGIRQIGPDSEVSSNTAVHAIEIDNETLGEWRMVVMQVRVTSIDTTADTTPPDATTRGAGASFSLWVDDGDVGYETTTMSSYRGASNLGFQCNRVTLGASYSSGSTLLNASNLLVGRSFVTMEDIAYGDADWLSAVRWLGGV